MSQSRDFLPPVSGVACTEHHVTMMSIISMRNLAFAVMATVFPDHHTCPLPVRYVGCFTTTFLHFSRLFDDAGDL